MTWTKKNANRISEVYTILTLFVVVLFFGGWLVLFFFWFPLCLFKTRVNLFFVSLLGCKLKRSQLDGGFKYFSFHPLKSGRNDPIWRLHIFQTGWLVGEPTTNWVDLLTDHSRPSSTEDLTHLGFLEVLDVPICRWDFLFFHLGSFESNAVAASYPLKIAWLVDVGAKKGRFLDLYKNIGQVAEFKDFV